MKTPFLRRRLGHMILKSTFELVIQFKSGYNVQDSRLYVDSRRILYVRSSSQISRLIKLSSTM